MALEIKDVKVEVNKPEINFDSLELEKSEKAKLKKQKAIIIASTAATVGAALISKAYKAKKKINKKK